MKKIVIITQGLSRIVQPLNNHESVNVVGIIECAPRRVIKSESSRLLSMYHRICGRQESKLLLFARQHNIPFYYMRSSSSDLEAWIKSLDPDLIVVYVMSQLLSENIFQLPRFGTINLHPSLLPKYRGPNPCFWTYFNMEKIGGVTVHFIDKGEDTGDILLQEEYEIPLGIKSPERFDTLIDKIGVNLLIKAIVNIEHIIPLKQPSISPTKRARNLKLHEHKSIINWSEWPIERIWHVLRGAELWLNAIPEPNGIYLGTRWIIDEFEKISFNEKFQIGKVYKRNGKYFIVCKDGFIYMHSKVNVKALVSRILNKYFW